MMTFDSKFCAGRSESSGQAGSRKPFVLAVASRLMLWQRGYIGVSGRTLDGASMPVSSTRVQIPVVAVACDALRMMEVCP